MYCSTVTTSEFQPVDRCPIPACNPWHFTSSNNFMLGRLGSNSTSETLDPGLMWQIGFRPYFSSHANNRMLLNTGSCTPGAGLILTDPLHPSHCKWSNGPSSVQWKNCSASPLTQYSSISELLGMRKCHMYHHEALSTMLTHRCQPVCQES